MVSLLVILGLLYVIFDDRFFKTNTTEDLIFKSIFNYIPVCITLNDKMIKSFESDIWVCDTKYSKNKYNFECKYNIIDGIIDMFKEKEKE